MRNISEQSLQNGLVVTLRELKKQIRTNRTNQISPLGYFPLPQGISTTVEALSGVTNGSLYYATDLLHIRALINGSWVTVV